LASLESTSRRSAGVISTCRPVSSRRIVSASALNQSCARPHID